MHACMVPRLLVKGQRTSVCPRSRVQTPKYMQYKEMDQTSWTSSILQGSRLVLGWSLAMFAIFPWTYLGRWELVAGVFKQRRCLYNLLCPSVQVTRQRLVFEALTKQVFKAKFIKHKMSVKALTASFTLTVFAFHVVFLSERIV